MSNPKLPNAFVRFCRHIYNPLGFTKGYAFTLYFILSGALLGFTLARLQFLAYNKAFCPRNVDDQLAAPGECFYFSSGIPKVGLLLHLATVLPAGLLVVFQFMPVIRHKFLLYHRIAGYVVVVLSIASSVGALMSARRAFGGGLDVQAGTGLLTIAHLGSLGLAIWNIRRKQIEQHRAWMLRAWVYAGSIITVRFILPIAAVIASNIGSYYIAKPCAQIEYVTANSTEFAEEFPSCAGYISGANPEQWTTIKADFDGGSPGVMAALDMSFGMGLWLAFAIHAIGIEIYLHLTPGEHARLRNISYERQAKAGMRNPGNAGLTADKLGDGEPWTPPYDMETARQQEE